MKLKQVMLLMISMTPANAENINWIEDTSGDWFNTSNWLQEVIPSAGDDVFFNDSNIADPENFINIDNGGTGVVQMSDILVLNDKVRFNDDGAQGNPEEVDDGLYFDEIRANGAGGKNIIFNVPVVAHLISSNRHGATFNQPFAVDTILATSEHQDQWKLNAAATQPISHVLIDENRGADGDTIDGSFKVNADLTIRNLEFVWGSLQIGADTELTLGELTYHVFVFQEENNNISPIVIGENSRVVIEQMLLVDEATGETLVAENGTYGSEGNPDVEFESPLIEGSGVIVICKQSIFANNFETDSETCNQ